MEDQILKAAVSKYGLTQWARVASLLPKKTARQAKARWNEYLSPAVRAHEWEKKDDAKLLDVAKLFPNQWRSVAQIMGRTATQCMERYQKLLDSAVNGGSDDEVAENVDYAGPGIETLPALGNAHESLPSRPDAEDMDEDEREMLSEAKARLANTQGKKAKRKDRERLLAESRRIALLQKRRELKAAGINVSLTLKNKARRKEFDFNADIPHERAPLAGKFDVLAEDALNTELRAAFQKLVNAKGLGDGLKKRGKESTNSIKAAAGLVARLDDHRTKRMKLDLPEPGAADEAQVLGSHIAQVSRHLVTQEAPAPLLEQKAPLSRKKVVSNLKNLLLSLPEPTKQRRVSFKIPELAASSEPEASASTLEVLHPVEEQFIQTQALQQGLPIPPLEGFDVQEQDPIARQILDEARLLVMSDSAQQCQPTPRQVEPLGSEYMNNAEALVAAELSSMAPQSLHEKVTQPKLSKLGETVDTIYELLNGLSVSAQGFEAQVESLQALVDNAHTFAGLCQEMAQNSELLHQSTFELNTARAILQDEEIAIQTRSATLSELVERLRAAENRVKSRRFHPQGT